MNVYPHDRAAAGEYVDPLPINRELRNLVARHNGLDRWSVDGTLTRERFALGAWGEHVIFTEGIAASGGVYDWSPTNMTVSVQKGIPDDAGEPWVEEVETGDALLAIGLTAHVSTAGSAAARVMRLGVLVDGQLVAVSPSRHVYNDTIHVHGEAFVGAGVHTIQPVFFLWVSVPSSFEPTFESRMLVVREAAR